MKTVRNCYSLMAAIALLSLTVLAQNSFTARDKAVISDFDTRVKEYNTLREKLEGQSPKIPKKATPEQIEFHKTALQKSVQAARVGAKQGEIITPAATQIIRAIIKSDFKGRDRKELRKDVFETESKGITIKVNVAYPESKELVEMPPSLLLALPQLPKALQYRFVGTNLILVDRENNVIVDYMTNALP